MKIDAAPSQVILTATPTQPKCYGETGSVSLSTSGGTGAYTYDAGNPALTNLAAGSYTYKVKDANGCEAQATVKIDAAPSQVSGSTNVTNVDCTGPNTGAIDLTPSGGTGSYTFLWSNGAKTEDLSSVPAGKYSVTITDANGCQTTASATVNPATNCITPHIYPTATTCCNYQGGTAQLLKGCLTMSTSTKGPNTTYTVSNAIPGVFFYYGTYTATTGGATTIVVTQSNDLGWKFFDPQNASNVRLFTNNCQSVRGATYSIDKQGNATINFTATAGSTYVVSVKYDMKSIIGQTTKSLPAAGTPIDTYKFQMFVNGSSTAYPNSTGALPLYIGCSDNTPNPTGSCPNQTLTVAAQRGDQSTVVSKISVSATPNPYTDKVRFVIKSVNSGRASLEVYNMLGQKLHTVFEGQVQAGVSQTIEYSVPDIYRSTLIYQFRQAGKIETGKLLQGRK